MNTINYLIAFFCFVPLALFQQNNTYTLELSTDDKPTVHGFSYWGEVKITSKDTSFYYALHSSKPDKIEGLKKGIYKVTCTSVFNHSVSLSIELGKKKVSKLKFKGLNSFYKKAPEIINLTERLKNNDTLYIVFSSNHSGILAYEKLGIAKKDGKYTAIQFKGLTSDVFQEMGITDAQFNQVIKFEFQAKKLISNPACYAPEIYTMELKGETFLFSDNTCSWKGLDNLKGSLFVQIGK